MKGEGKTAVERNAYARGYAAGKRKGYETRSALASGDVWERSFIAAIPACVDARGWQVDGKPVNTITERMYLARCVADAALVQYKKVRP